MVWCIVMRGPQPLSMRSAVDLRTVLETTPVGGRSVVLPDGMGAAMPEPVAAPGPAQASRRPCHPEGLRNDHLPGWFPERSSGPRPIASREAEDHASRCTTPFKEPSAVLKRLSPGFVLAGLAAAMRVMGFMGSMGGMGGMGAPTP